MKIDLLKATASMAITTSVTIIEILSFICRDIETLEQRRAKALALKQGMMQTLLIGRSRLV